MSKAPPETHLENPTILDLHGDVATVLLAEPLPPGARVVLVFSSPVLSARGKLSSLRRRGDSGLAATVRLHDVSRSERALLEELVE
ncbi:MAG: hypothetical protein R6V85_11365 [Polyangia bacterium]